MNELSFYLTEGIHHITDPKGFDHMLFVVTLCSFYQLYEIKKIFILVTAFTIGHSITLALSSLDIIQVNQTTVELLIPATIFLTSIFNIIAKQKVNSKFGLNYLLALFFGLIHGMGFSNFFRSMMMGIQEGSIALPLLGFNLGIEIGQLVIVAIFLVLLLVYTNLFKGAHRDWKIYFSGAGAALSISLILNQL